MPDKKMADVQRKTNWQPRTLRVQQLAIRVIQGGTDQEQPLEPTRVMMTWWRLLRVCMPQQVFARKRGVCQLHFHPARTKSHHLLVLNQSETAGLSLWTSGLWQPIARVSCHLHYFSRKLGAKVESYTLQVNTAATAGELEVAVKVASLVWPL
ncbi:MAG: hypothetical protein GY696_26440 [Gammaproteobacteria bacterium]|nr:hypothetical protein [Gammaproteobacteria bacterium]